MNSLAANAGNTMTVVMQQIASRFTNDSDI